MFNFCRTNTCGELTAKDQEKQVILSGWVNKRRDHGGLIFIDLRDKFGITQLVFDPNVSSPSHDAASSLRSEYVISIHGKVRKRKEGMINKKMETGEIEIEVEKLKILSIAKTPPFSISDEKLDIKEETTLKYRYLDIRRGDILKKLKIRDKASLATRNFLHDSGFMEVETPILSKTTPEGARDYLVPSRIYPGNFYALPQSPQLFKQILMISGADRYFQIAKCFRDENLRADRQPEFTQIDLEMSFSTPDILFSLIENLMKEIFKKSINVDIKTPFKRLTYKECMESYGSDKPDLRFAMKLIRIDSIIEKSNFSILKEVLTSGGCVKAICVKNGATISRKKIDGYANFIKKFGIQGLAWMKKEENYSSSIVKFFEASQLDEITKLLNVEKNDLVLMVAEKEENVNQALDHLRRHIAKEQNIIPKNSYNFLWVVDFPMFSFDKKTNSIQSEHHPFTSPHVEDLPLMEKDPLSVRALAYDLVLNGYETASGSQRIHDSGLQENIFKILKISEDDIKIKFGYFIEALKYGTPPHLGIALGLDRIAMILTGTDNIRDVIAFPKTQKASDLMTRSPSKPSSDQLSELKLKTEYEEIFWT